ncbi:MAG TPA: phage tail sheath C-terminal domain-containing protein [Paucimonas sp.]|nr:phage tail sheath C-terminal domain-containing protein [Paucimonas sp.]
MPVTVTYPGVYIEEIPSGVRTITGVATSITAFLGRALRGPTDDPVTINSYGDFERIFGGLWSDSSLGYAVRDFYLNGGSQAIIVRLYHPKFASRADRDKAAQAAKDTADAAAGNDAAAAAAAAKTKADTYTTEPERSAAQAVAAAAKAAADVTGASVADVKAAADATAAAIAPISKATLNASGIALEAKYEGAWGNQLRARIDHDVVGADAANLFNLSVRDGSTGQIEIFRNVSVRPGHPRQVDKVLENESRLVKMTGALPATRPAPHPAPDPTLLETDVWADNTVATNAKVADADKASDGVFLDVNDFTGPGKQDRKEGLYALRKADLFNILCIPPYLEDGNVDYATLIGAAAAYCEQRRAMLLVDPPTSWDDKDRAKNGVASIGTDSKNAALFFPRLRQPNPLHDGQLENFAPCGAVAGIFARTDTTRGVWKAPAGLDATLVGVPQLSVALNDAENGELNPLGINCLRVMPGAGRIVWGARTRQGDDRVASEWKYIPVRRTALYIEESLYRGTQWAVFEPNDEPLWAQLRLNLGAFMHNLFRQGAFQGKTPQEAYFVKCDKETTTQNDINLGIVNIVVGFAPLKPAEFVIIKVQQIAGQIQV